jgi:hypothetical protein
MSLIYPNAISTDDIRTALSYGSGEASFGDLCTSGLINPYGLSQTRCPGDVSTFTSQLNNMHATPYRINKFWDYEHGKSAPGILRLNFSLSGVLPTAGDSTMVTLAEESVWTIYSTVVGNYTDITPNFFYPEENTYLYIMSYGSADLEGSITLLSTDIAQLNDGYNVNREITMSYYI